MVLNLMLFYVPSLPSSAKNVLFEWVNKDIFQIHYRTSFYPHEGGDDIILAFLLNPGQEENLRKKTEVQGNTGHLL